MKKFFFFALVALMMSCGSKASTSTKTSDEAAQGSSETTTAENAAPTSERDGYKFEISFRKDENDQCDALILKCKKGKKFQEFTCEFPWAKDRDLMGEAGEIEEEDLNFDGMPDLLICLGNFAVGFEPDYYYCAFLWDEKTLSFREIGELSEKANLHIDKEKRTIISEYKTVVGDHVTETYQWENGKIVLKGTESFNPDELEEE